MSSDVDRHFTKEKEMSNKSVFGFIERQDMQILHRVWGEQISVTVEWKC